MCNIFCKKSHFFIHFFTQDIIEYRLLFDNFFTAGRNIPNFPTQYCSVPLLLIPQYPKNSKHSSYDTPLKSNFFVSILTKYTQKPPFFKISCSYCFGEFFKSAFIMIRIFVLALQVDNMISSYYLIDFTICRNFFASHNLINSALFHPVDTIPFLYAL